MYIPFVELPPEARIWIYQSDRSLTTHDVEKINEMSQTFLEDWAAHGASLKSSFKVLHDRFVVIGVDEQYNQASGCSIDASVALIKGLESSLKVNFFDRSKICFLKNDQIFDLPMTKIKENISNGTIDSNTVTFNNLISDVGSLKDSWQIKAKDSWLKRHFN